jgi:hypothetical protein
MEPLWSRSLQEFLLAMVVDAMKTEVAADAPLHVLPND